jgi:hypothetical protein
MNLSGGNFYLAHAHISYSEQARATFNVETFLPNLVAKVAGEPGFTSRAQLSQVGPNPTMAVYAVSSPQTADEITRLIPGLGLLLSSSRNWRALEVAIVFYVTAPPGSLVSFPDSDLRWPLSTAIAAAFGDSGGHPPTNMAGMLNVNSNPQIYNLEITAHDGLRPATQPPALFRTGLASITTSSVFELTRGFMPPQTAGGRGTVTGGPSATGSWKWMAGGVIAAIAAGVIYYGKRQSGTGYPGARGNPGRPAVATIKDGHRWVPCIVDQHEDGWTVRKMLSHLASDTEPQAQQRAKVAARQMTLQYIGD